MRNSEHYLDLTAGKALKNIEHERLNNVIKEIKQILIKNDFELVDRIKLRDKKTGRIYK